MKHSAYLFTSLVLLCLLGGVSYANETNIAHHTSSPITNISILNQLLSSNTLTLIEHSNDFTSESNAFESKPQIQGKFTASLVSIETGVIQSQQSSSWSKYYLNGAITLHHNRAFNLSLTANIEQLKENNFSYYQMPSLESINSINDAELNYSYGLIGSYSINSTWHFSGGIIHSPNINQLNNVVIYSNTNMALVGTTYSF